MGGQTEIPVPSTDLLSANLLPKSTTLLWMYRTGKFLVVWNTSFVVV